MGKKDLIENVAEAAFKGVRTGDIMADGFTQTGTDGMISKVINGLDAQARRGRGWIISLLLLQALSEENAANAVERAFPAIVYVCVQRIGGVKYPMVKTAN